MRRSLPLDRTSRYRLVAPPLTSSLGSSSALAHEPSRSRRSSSGSSNGLSRRNELGSSSGSPVSLGFGNGGRVVVGGLTGTVVGRGFDRREGTFSSPRGLFFSGGGGGGEGRTTESGSSSLGCRGEDGRKWAKGRRLAGGKRERGRLVREREGGTNEAQLRRLGRLGQRVADGEKGEERRSAEVLRTQRLRERRDEGKEKAHLA